jgi:tetratricopeptide (TPR) repeat protein
MVPTAPPSHAGEAQVDYHWLSKLARWLELGREKVAILIEGASAGGLRALVSHLLGHPSPPVICFHAPQLLDVPEGSLVVLMLHEAELNWLNLNRPLIANKRLRLLLWLEFPLYRLRSKAPDFFDWISHVVRCPERPPRFAERRVLAAKAAGCPVAWRGHALDAVMDRAGVALARIEAGGEFARTVATLEAMGDEVPFWTGARDVWHLLRIELAMQHTGRRWWVVEQPGFDDPRLASVSDRTLPWEAATERLGHTEATAERSALACVAALLEGEPESVERAARALAQGQALDDLLLALGHAADPAAAMAERSPDFDGPASISGRLGRIPTPAHTQLVRLHAAALASERSLAWIHAADRARAAGHADVAECFCERALAAARTDRRRQRATLALAVASHDAGHDARALEGLHRLIESLESASAADPLRALVLTEQAAMLVAEGDYADAKADASEAVEIWERLDRRRMSRPHREALRLHGRCLAALQGPHAVRDWLSGREGRWPGGTEGTLAFELERARAGDDGARDRVVRQIVDRAPGQALELGSDLAALLLELDAPMAVVAVGLRMLRALRTTYGTDMHPQGIAVRTFLGRALGECEPMRAFKLLRRALADSETIHGRRPHRQTLEVIRRLMEVERRRGDLAAAAALATRAEGMEDAIGAGMASGRTRTTFDVADRGSDDVRSRLQDLAITVSQPRSSLVKQAMRGDFFARDLFVASHAPAIHAYFSQLGPVDDLDDLVQRVFDRYLQRSQPSGASSSVRAELLDIAHRVLEDERDPTPDERGRLVDALRRLPTDEQVVLYLTHARGLGAADVARRLGCTQAAARSRARVARRRLSRLFQDARSAVPMPERSAYAESIDAWIADMESS